MDPINELVRRKFQEYFDPDHVEVRVGPTNLSKDEDEGVGMPLLYIPARRVQQRLDNVVGPMNWQVKYNPAVNRSKKQLGVEASIGIRDVNGEWVWKADVSQNTEMEGMKGGYSKALVRAGVQWGIGRYLYYIDDDMLGWKKVKRKYGRVTFSEDINVPIEFRPENDKGASKFSQKETRQLRMAAQGKDRDAITEVWDEGLSFDELMTAIQDLG